MRDVGRHARCIRVAKIHRDGLRKDAPGLPIIAEGWEHGYRVG
jgi:hypothetical protein